MTKHISTLRRIARGQGLTIKGTKARNPEDPRYGRYLVVDENNVLISGERGMTAPELQAFLTWHGKRLATLAQMED